MRGAHHSPKVFIMSLAGYGNLIVLMFGKYICMRLRVGPVQTLKLTCVWHALLNIFNRQLRNLEKKLIYHPRWTCTRWTPA